MKKEKRNLCSQGITTEARSQWHFKLSKPSDRDRDLVKLNPSSQYQGYDPGVKITIAHDRSGVVFYTARLVKLYLRSLTAMIYMDKFGKIRRQH